jgi:hypothetical protein
MMIKKRKYSVQYFSFPVASTFTPSKGKVPLVWDTSRKGKLFSNYLTFAAGNYGNVVELFVTHVS